MQQSRGKKEPCSPTVLFFFPLTSEHAIGPNGRVESWRPSPKGTPTDRKQYPPIFLTFLWPAVYVRANIWRIPLRSVGGDIHTVVRVTNGSGREREEEREEEGANVSTYFSSVPISSPGYYLARGGGEGDKVEADTSAPRGRRRNKRRQEKKGGGDRQTCPRKKLCSP